MAKSQLKRLEPIDREEYKILCYLRYRRRRAIQQQAIRVEVVIKNGQVRCRELIDNNK